MNKIAIHGAFDRFNYGDLLFPLILENVFADCKNNYDIDYFGLIDSDLSSYGAKPTKSIEQLFKAETLQDGSLLIIAGGEILGANWFELYGYTLPYSLKSFYLMLKRNVPKRYLLRLKPELDSSKISQPFLLSPKDFTSQIKIIYNAVGGVSLYYGNYSIKEYFQIIDKLNQATYVSVRDNRTKSVLESLSKKIEVHLVPDSATSLSKYFPPELLIKLANLEIKSWIEKYSGRYLVLQIAKKFCNDEATIEQISNQIEEIYLKHKLVTILCPIGMATGHEDFIPLSAIKNRVKTPILFLDNPSLFDIMTLIAYSNMFIGTSLHGAITAMSYAVPNLAFKIPSPKIQTYLDTWALEELRKPVYPNEICNAISEFKYLSKEKLERKRDDLLNISFKSLSEIKSIIMSTGENQFQPIPSKKPHLKFILLGRIIKLKIYGTFYRIARKLSAENGFICSIWKQFKSKRKKNLG